jgi:hypothetical protein
MTLTRALGVPPEPPPDQARPSVVAQLCIDGGEDLVDLSARMKQPRKPRRRRLAPDPAITHAPTLFDLEATE